MLELRFHLSAAGRQQGVLRRPGGRPETPGADGAGGGDLSRRQSRAERGPGRGTGRRPDFWPPTPTPCAAGSRRAETFWPSGWARRRPIAFLPFSVKTRKREYICSLFPPPARTSLLAGVGPADVMNRDPRDIELLSEGATRSRRRRAGRCPGCQCRLLPTGSLGVRLPEILQPEADVPAGKLPGDAHPGQHGRGRTRRRCWSGLRFPSSGLHENRWQSGFYLDQPRSSMILIGTSNGEYLLGRRR